MKWVWMLLALTAGMAVSVQAGVNGGLGKRIGVLEGAFVSFLSRNDRLIFSAIVFRKRRIAGHVFCAEMAADGRHSRRFLCVCHGADPSESRRRQLSGSRDRRPARHELDH